MHIQASLVTNPSKTELEHRKLTNFAFLSNFGIYSQEQYSLKVLEFLKREFHEGVLLIIETER